MPVRDRFQELALHRKRSTWGSFKAATRPMAKKDKNITSVLQLARDAQVNIDILSKKTEQLRKSYSDVIASPFSENKQLARIREINCDISDVSHRIQAQLDSINPRKAPGCGNTGNNSNSGGGNEVDENTAEFRVRYNQHRTLNARFQFLVSVQRQAELQFEDKGRQRVKRQLSILGKSKAVSEDTIDIVVNKGDFAYFNQQVLTDDDVALAEVHSYLKQEEQVVNMEMNIHNLHTMFKDLKVAVNDQGEIINSIQHHMVKSVSYVEEGTDHISKAKKYTKRFSKTKMALGVILMVALLFGLIATLLFSTLT